MSADTVTTFVTAELITFVRARLREREHRANLAKQAIGTTMYDSRWENVAQQLVICCDTVPLAGRAMQMLNLDADPDVILADVAAQRASLDAYELIATKEQENAEEAVRHSRRGPGWSDAEWAQTMTNLRTHGWERSGQLVAARHTVRCLALPYAGHPDYREEFRP